MFRKPLKLYSLETSEEISFRNMEEVYSYPFEGTTIAEFIAGASKDIFMMVLD